MVNIGPSDLEWLPWCFGHNCHDPAKAVITKKGGRHHGKHVHDVFNQAKMNRSVKSVRHICEVRCRSERCERGR